jgi:Carboxypeptidase regulatory-like domain
MPNVRPLVPALLLIAALPSIKAQNATGAINGSVADPNGAAVANAAVTATSKDTGFVRKSVAGNEGSFVFENLQPGEYEVRVEHPGFSSQKESVTVEIGGTTTLSFALTLGATTQIIEVSGAAAVVNTTDTALGGIVNRDQVDNLPLNGRSFLSMAMLEPGVAVSYASTSGAGNPNNFFQVSVNGAPQSMTVISFDGARVNDRVTGGTSQNFSSESVAEFQISTFNFDLSTGTVSAGAINVVSRTGTNQLHGSGFFFFRDHNMAAYPALRRDPFYPDPYFARKQYGFSLGGPIKKDRLFFFGNFERNDQVGARTVVFTDPLLTSMNHVAKQPLKNNLGALRLDYQLNSRNSLYVRGNLDSNNSLSGTGIESSWVSSNNYAYQTAMGVTSVIKPTLVNDFRFSYSYFRNRLTPPAQAECAYAAGNPEYCLGAGGPRISFFGGLTIGNDTNVPQDRHPRTYQVTDNMNWTKGVHRVRFGGNMELDVDHGSWSRNSTGAFGVFNPTQLANQNPALYAALPASLKIGSTVGPPAFAELMQLPVNGAFTIGLGDPGQPANYQRDKTDRNRLLRFYIQDAWQLRRNLTLNYGVGWSWENNIVYHNTTRSPFLYPLIGQQPGTVPQDLNNFDPAVGLAWAAGKSHKTVFRSGFSVHHASLNVEYLKLNDAILNSPAGIGLSQASSASVPNPKFGQPGQPATVNFTTPTNFTAGDLTQAMQTFAAVIQAGLKYTGGDPSIRNVDVVKTIQGPGSNDVFFDKNFHTPYTAMVTAGVQRELARRLVISADYVMRRGVKFGAFEGEWVDLNRWNKFDGYTLSSTGVNTVGTRHPVIPACTGAQSTDPKAECSLGPIQYGMPGILSRYQALQIKVNKGTGRGFQFTGSYALARYKSFVSVSSFDNLFDGYGTASGNRKHRFTGSAIWEVPKYRGGSKLGRGALSGWQLSTLMEMDSGAPSTVSLGSFDVDGDGNFTFRLPGTRPNSFGSGQSASDIRRLVDQYNATFAGPANAVLAQIGRQNRDAIGVAYPYVVLPDHFSNSDTFLTHDLRISRSLRLAEKLRLQLMAEGFNIFNIANLTGYSGTLDRVTRPTVAGGPATNPSFNFGQPTGRVNPIFGTGGPRAMQLAARLTF